MKISNEDTICAIATPPGRGGIGIVRISGPEASRVLSSLWRGRVPCKNFEVRRLYLGEIAVGDKSVDRVMAVWMPAPATYTGQDVVEFSCHGSPVVLGQILRACLSAGARMAGPGEFTRRAFLSGKMDLAQAEGVAEIIHATSESAARRATEQMAGKLSGEVGEVSDVLGAIRAFIEASIDFPDEDIEMLRNADIEPKLSRIFDRVKSLSATFDQGRLIRDGVRTAIIGKPNVGKSSILNRLAGFDRAIVHPAPGTTRDVVEESVVIGEFVFHFRDTAGLRNSACEIERMGIAKTKDEISRVDLVIAVFDGSEPVAEDDLAIIEELDAKRSIIVINKADLPRAFNAGDINWKILKPPVLASAKTGEGIDVLKDRLIKYADVDCGPTDGAAVISARHKELLDEAAACMHNTLNCIRESEPIECIAQTLRMAQESLDQITGDVTTEDLLDRIFSTFCIGK